MAMALSANKLKLKIITRKPDPNTCEIVKPPLSRDAGKISAYGSGKAELDTLKKCGIHASHFKETITTGDRKQAQSILGAKRGADEMVDLHSRKKLKMDRSMKRKCSMILKKLMAHQYSWPFLQPVDPVALKIPDYFSIISKPMDLGTVKSNLESNMYATAEEFEADVKLTFSNAMRYNPPENSIHNMAKELNALFSSQWRFAGSFVDKQNIFSDGEKKIHDAESSRLRIVSAHSEVISGNSTVLMEKTDGKGSKEVMVGKDTKVIKKHNTKISNASKLSSSNPVTPCAKSSVHVESASANSTHINSLHKRSTQYGRRTIPEQMKEASIGKKAPLIDIITPEKIMDEVANNFKPQMSRSDHDSDGAGSCLDEEHACAAVTSVSTATASEEWRSQTCEIQLSPGKALRAAMLKRRFADTILKAQQQRILLPGDKFDPVKMDEEKKRLERKQHEEKLKIEAQIKASREKLDTECKMQRERERKAARKSLEKMERSVEFEDNITILRDLAHIIGDFSFAGPLRGYGGMYVASNQFVNGKLKNPLERLGLFLKEEDDHAFVDDSDHEREETPLKDCEEGELIVT